MHKGAAVIKEPLAAIGVFSPSECNQIKPKSNVGDWRQLRRLPPKLCTNPCYATALLEVFGRPFVKRFALCYRSVVCTVCLSCLWRWCIVAKRL